MFPAINWVVSANTCDLKAVSVWFCAATSSVKSP